MKESVKKYFKLGLAGVLGVLLLPTSNFAFAGDENYGYSFYIQPEYLNNYSSDIRYRQTTSSSNPWKVDLRSSGEGTGTYTTFWLHALNPLDEWQRGSTVRDVKQGSGATYTGAYSWASQTNTKLGAENNNYSTNGYYVSGYWDEETW